MSNLKFKATPSFDKLNEFLGTRQEKTLGYSTTVARRTIDGETHFEIRYHGNLIGAVGENDVFVSNKGWGTPTTRNRINKILNANGINYGTGQKNYAQLLYGPDWEIVTDTFYSAYFKRDENGWSIVA